MAAPVGRAVVNGRCLFGDAVVVAELGISGTAPFLELRR